MLSNRLFVSAVAKRLLHRRSSDVTRDKILATNDFLRKILGSARIKSPEDWKAVREEALTAKGQITPTNIDAMTVGICTSMKNYDLAFSYLDYLKAERIKPNLATLGKYFKLLYLKNCEMGHTLEDEDRILMLYENIRKSHPVLDSLTLDSVVQAVSITKQWRLCLELLEEIKIAALPSHNCYSAVVAAAFLNNEEDLAWKLLTEMLNDEKIPQEIVYLSYFKKIEEMPKEAIEKMFHFLHNSHLKITENVARKFVEAAARINVAARLSDIHKNGFCKCCKGRLQKFDLTEAEFDDLRTKMLSNVIVGKDIFNKTTPEELARFKEFTSRLGHHDVVIDGLNVCYSTGVKQSPLVTSGLLAAVVSHFASQNKKVLVLGRSHMSRLPKKNWNYVTSNATVFLTQDLSQDDPYLLYCALTSGKDTAIVTRDLMRSHKFLLKDFQQKQLFNRWLSQRQYQLIRVNEDGRPIFRFPPSFSDLAQKTGQFWHVPCENPNRDAPSTTWLCLKFNK